MNNFTGTPEARVGLFGDGGGDGGHGSEAAVGLVRAECQRSMLSQWRGLASMIAPVPLRRFVGGGR